MYKSIRSPLAVSLLALVAACSQPETGDEAVLSQDTAPAASQPDAATATEQTESERLYAWFDELFQADLARSPQTRTALGQIDNLDAYGRWDAVSEEAAAADQERRIERLDYLRENFDPDTLNDDARVSYMVFEYLQETGIRQYTYRDQGYVFTQMFGPHTGMPTLLISQHRVDTPEHAEAYIQRLERMAPVDLPREPSPHPTHLHQPFFCAHASMPIRRCNDMRELNMIKF